MFEDFGKSNLVNWLALGVVAAVLPKLLPDMSPAMESAVKIVLDLFTESEAEAAEELLEALVSSTVAEINRHVADAENPEKSRSAVEHSVAHFKHKAHQRAHRWGADHEDRSRRYRRHLATLHKAVERAKDEHEGWQRDLLDDVGDSLEEAA
jgi:hypothetical protein